MDGFDYLLRYISRSHISNWASLHVQKARLMFSNLRPLRHRCYIRLSSNCWVYIARGGQWSYLAPKHGRWEQNNAKVFCCLYTFCFVVVGELSKKEQILRVLAERLPQCTTCTAEEFLRTAFKWRRSFHQLVRTKRNPRYLQPSNWSSGDS